MAYEMKSTRHTAIGTLRMGTIYHLNDADPQVRRTLEPLLNSGAAVKLTDKEVAARKAEVVSLELPAHEHHDPDTVDEIAELEARLVVADEEKAEAEAARDAAIARAEAAEAALAEAAGTAGKASKK